MYTAQVKNVYVKLLYNCYVDSGLDNKETFAKDHMWTLFKSAVKDIDKVPSPYSAVCRHVRVSTPCISQYKAYMHIHIYLYM